MTSLLSSRARISFARRVFASMGVLVCLAMATSNLVGAFASDSAAHVPATVTTDVETYLKAGNDTLVLTLASLDVKEAVKASLAENNIGVITDNLSVLPVISVDDVSIEELAVLVDTPGIITIEPNREVRPNAIQHLDTIAAEVVNSPTNPSTRLTGKGINIGILDSGINIDHPSFKDAQGNTRVISLGCSADPDPVTPCETNTARAAHQVCTLTKLDELGCYHGTTVADFAAGRHLELTLKDGTTLYSGGVAPEATIVFSRVAIPLDGSITYATFIEGLDRLVAAVVENGTNAPDVVSISYGFPTADPSFCTTTNAVKVAFDAMVSRGVPVVVSSGNAGAKNNIMFPSCLPNAIAVGATEYIRDAQGAITGEQVVDFSNMSPDIDLVAPGTLNVSQVPNPEQFVYSSGTSFATPLVSGAVALLKQAKPTISVAEAKELLISTSQRVTDPATGTTYPRINVQAAVNKLISTTTTAPDVTVPVTVTTTPVTTTPITVPSTTRAPSPGGNRSAEINLTVSKPKAFFGEKVRVIATVTNTGTNAIENLLVVIKTGEHVYKSVTVPSLPVGDTPVTIFDGELEAGRVIEIIDEEKKIFDLTGEISATACWDTNVCDSTSQPLEVVDALVELTVYLSTDPNSPKMSLTNIGGSTITNLRVEEIDLGPIPFDKTTLEPGDTTDSFFVYEDLPDKSELVYQVRGSVDGIDGLIAQYEMDLSDLAPDETTTTTVIPPTTAPVVVGGEHVTNTGAGGETLPYTGSTSTQLVFAAVWILLAGVMLLCFKEGFTRRALVYNQVQSHR